MVFISRYLCILVIFTMSMAMTIENQDIYLKTFYFNASVKVSIYKNCNDHFEWQKNKFSFSTNLLSVIYSLITKNCFFFVKSAPLKPLESSRQYVSKGFQGGPQFVPHYAERHELLSDGKRTTFQIFSNVYEDNFCLENFCIK